MFTEMNRLGETAASAETRTFLRSLKLSPQFRKPASLKGSVEKDGSCRWPLGNLCGKQERLPILDSAAGSEVFLQRDVILVGRVG